MKQEESTGVLVNGLSHLTGRSKTKVGLRSTLRWGQWDRTVRLVADHEIAITDIKLDCFEPHDARHTIKGGGSSRFVVKSN